MRCGQIARKVVVTAFLAHLGPLPEDAHGPLVPYLALLQSLMRAALAIAESGEVEVMAGFALRAEESPNGSFIDQDWSSRITMHAGWRPPSGRTE